MTLAIAKALADGYEPPNVRAIEMGQLYAEGLTLQEIGDRYGVSRQRVEQIIRPFGLKAHYGERKKAERALKLTASYGRIVAGESTLDEEAERMGYASGSSLRSIFADQNLRIATRQAPAEHGTIRKYGQGCHCEECRRAHREQQYAYRQNRGEPPQHGTASGYSNYACRCQECKEAIRLYRRELRARKRQEQPTDA